MSNGQEDVSSQPLVIVRRRRNTEETHHGGVWKIAYADFMTAMMAFFLVMWLINAADKKTIVQVAAYFNPMRLTDRFAAPKGLDDLTEVDPKKNDEKSKETKHGFAKKDDKQKLDAPSKTKAGIGESMDE
jgi:chemotaxis protein MotB